LVEAWVFGIARDQLAAYYRCGSIERRALARLRWSVPQVDGALDDELERVVERDAIPQMSSGRCRRCLLVDGKRCACESSMA
jgi:hypothetical protein